MALRRDRRSSPLCLRQARCAWAQVCIRMGDVVRLWASYRRLGLRRHAHDAPHRHDPWRAHEPHGRPGRASIVPHDPQWSHVVCAPRTIWPRCAIACAASARIISAHLPVFLPRGCVADHWCMHAKGRGVVNGVPYLVVSLLAPIDVSPLLHASREVRRSQHICRRRLGVLALAHRWYIVWPAVADYHMLRPGGSAAKCPYQSPATLGLPGSSRHRLGRSGQCRHAEMVRRLSCGVWRVSPS